MELLTTTFQINRDSDDWCGKDYWIIQFISSFLSPPLPLDPSLSKPELPPKPREKQLSLAPLSCPLTSTLRWGHRRSSQQVELSVSEPPEQGHLLIKQLGEDAVEIDGDGVHDVEPQPEIAAG